MLTSPSSSPLVPGMSSVTDFQFALQSLAQPFPALALSKPLASISIPQPLARLPPQIPSSLYVPTTSTEVVKKQANRGLKGVRRHTPSNDKVKKRLARKAELARASRRRKKAYIQDLEDKVNRLSQQVLQLQRERALLGLGPPALAFPPITISPRHSNGNNSGDGKLSDGDDSSDEMPTQSAPFSQVGESDCNGVILDGLSGLATAASSLAPIETTPDTLPSGESKNSNPSSKLEEPNCERDKVNPVAKARPPGLFRLSSPVPSTSRLNSSSSTQPINQSPSFPSSPLLSSARLSAFTDTRQGKSDPIERCIKATYKGDTRRFSLNINNFTYSTLLQTLRETYQNLPPTFAVKYCDEEDDLINITTTAEFREAYRLLCLSPSSSPSDPSSTSPAILKLLIEDSSGTPTQARRSTSAKTQSSPRKKKLHKRKKTSSLTSSPSESPPSLSSPSSKKRKSGQVGRDIPPVPPLFPSSSFPIFFQGLETTTSDDSIVPCCLIVDASMTIEQMKNDIAKQHPPPPGVCYQYSFQGQVLDDNNRRIKDFGLIKGSVVRLERVETPPPPPLHSIPSTIPALTPLVPCAETVSMVHLPSFSFNGIEHSTQHTQQIQDSASMKNRTQNKNLQKGSNSSEEQECSTSLAGTKKFPLLETTVRPVVLGT